MPCYYSVGTTFYFNLSLCQSFRFLRSMKSVGMQTRSPANPANTKHFKNVLKHCAKRFKNIFLWIFKNIFKRCGEMFKKIIIKIL